MRLNLRERKWLLPLAWVFQSVVTVRRYLYQKQILKTHRVSKPVIVVGNITVGGTGKTPLVIWLAQFLKAQGYKPGIVSRGVGGKQQRAPRWVRPDANVAEVGDEAILIAQQTQCPFVIGIDRVAAAQTLLDNSDCDVVIADDGLQHYRLARDIEIAIVDGDRESHYFLPAGRLRESSKRLDSVDFIVVNGAAREDAYTMSYQIDNLRRVNHENESKTLKEFSHKKVHAIAGIGNPKRFFSSLRAVGIEVIEHIFPDHYLYQSGDIQFADDLPVIMTEKDAVKCRTFSGDNHWYLPIQVKIADAFAKKLLLKLN